MAPLDQQSPLQLLHQQLLGEDAVGSQRIEPYPA